MELKDFIAATLVQLIEGVVAATPRAQELGAFINPADTLSTNYGGKPHSPAVEIPGQGRDKRFLQMVEFDVAILVKESTQAQAFTATIDETDAAMLEAVRGGMKVLVVAWGLQPTR